MQKNNYFVLLIALLLLSTFCYSATYTKTVADGSLPARYDINAFVWQTRFDSNMWTYTPNIDWNLGQYTLT